MRLKNWLILLTAGASVSALSACSIAKGYSDTEKEMLTEMTPSKYQPASRQMRSSIETQELLAQAAFWSREYQLNPADLEAAVKLASAVRKMGNPSKAAEITQTTRAMYPDDPYLIAEHSAALIALERGKEAMKPLDKALHAAPGYARLWSLKGAALDQVGNYDVARQHYNRALQITPNDPNIMANMGLSFALAGDPRTAEQWLRRAVAHPDAGDGIRQNLDLVLQLQGKPAQYAHMQKSPPPIQQQQAARGTYTPPSAPMTQSTRQYNSPMAQPSHLGHRSSMAVVGNQAGGPRTAAEMARAAAAKSQQNRVVVPHEPSVQPSGNILDRIGRSVNQKQAVVQRPPSPPVYSAQSVPSQPHLSRPQVRQPVQRQGSPYPVPQQQVQQQTGYPVQNAPQQGQPQAPQGYQGYASPYGVAPQQQGSRRGAARRR